MWSVRPELKHPRRCELARPPVRRLSAQLLILTVFPIGIFSSCCQRVSLVFFEIYAAGQNIKKFYTFQ